MRKFINRATYFAAGVFCVSTINGIVNSNIYLWLPCMFLTLLALVCATGYDD